MIRFAPLFVVLPVSVLAFLSGNVAQAANITLSVDQEPQQIFEAFGFSVSRMGGYYPTKASDAAREKMNEVSYDDLNTNVVRLWFDYSYERFVDRYIESGVIPDAVEHGVQWLLLGPIPWTGESGALRSNNPDWVSGGYITNIEAHAKNIAETIKRVRDEHGYDINITGMVNEPGSGPRPSIRKEDYTRQVKILRQELDSRGLQHVKIVGLEWQPPSGTSREYAQILAKDPEAKEVTYAIATHSYGIAIPRDHAEIALENGWAYVQSESGGASGTNGAARLVHDINNAVTHWVFFIGPHNGTGRHSLTAPSGDGVKISGHYWPLQVISTSFLPGTQIYHTTSSKDGNMIYHRSRTSSVYGAAGVRPDGKWVFGAVTMGGGHSLTWEVPGLDAGISFEVCRAGTSPMKCGETVTSQDGRLQVSIGGSQALSLVAKEATEPVRTDPEPQPQPQPQPEQSAGPCHRVSSANPQAIPQGFGMPFNVLSTSRELLVSVTCSNTGAQLSVGSGNNVQYIYRLAYTWLGGGWQQVNLSGANLVGGAWYVGSAQAQLPQSAAQLSQDNFVVAYVCTWRGGRWLCGCRDQQCARGLWQLQVFRR